MKLDIMKKLNLQLLFVIFKILLLIRKKIKNLKSSIQLTNQ